MVMRLQYIPARSCARTSWPTSAWRRRGGVPAGHLAGDLEPGAAWSRTREPNLAVRLERPV